MGRRPPPAAFASDLDAFIAFADLERGLSRNTQLSYAGDLGQAAAHFSAQLPMCLSPYGSQRPS